MRRHGDRVAINARNVPRPLRDKFKAWAAARGLDMNEALCRLMRRAMRENIKLGRDLPSETEN